MPGPSQSDVQADRCRQHFYHDKFFTLIIIVNKWIALFHQKIHSSEQLLATANSTVCCSGQDGFGPSGGTAVAGQRQGADGELCSDVRAGPTARLTRDWIPVRLMDVCTSCNAWRMFSFLLSTFENNSSNRFDGTILRHKNKLIFLGHLIYIPMLAMHFSRRL